MPLADQVSVFILTVAIGMLAGFCFDVYRVVRNLFRLRRVGTFLGDIFFWLAFTGLSFYILLLGNAGEVRFYVFIGLSVGALIYLQVLGKYTYPVVEWVFYLIRRIVQLFFATLSFIWKVVTFPFKILFVVILFPLRLLTRGLGYVKKGLGKIGGRLIGQPARKIKLKLTIFLQRLKPRG